MMRWQWHKLDRMPYAIRLYLTSDR